VTRRRAERLGVEWRRWSEHGRGGDLVGVGRRSWSATRRRAERLGVRQSDSASSGGGGRRGGSSHSRRPMRTCWAAAAWMVGWAAAVAGSGLLLRLGG
jgi:hypothetical protein